MVCYDDELLGDVMAGLLPQRRSQEEIEQANDRLLKQHFAALESWVRSSTENSEAQRTAEKPARKRMRA